MCNCPCISCQYSRGEITAEQYKYALEQRLEVWEIVESYFTSYGVITEENIHDLAMNVDCAKEEINCFLAELEKKKKEEQNG